MEIEGDFWADGGACASAARSARPTSPWPSAIDANLADLSPRAKRASAATDGAFVEDFCNWERIPALHRFVRTVAGRRPGAGGSSALVRSASITTTCW